MLKNKVISNLEKRQELIGQPDTIIIETRTYRKTRINIFHIKFSGFMFIFKYM